MEMYLAMIAYHQQRAATAHKLATISRDLFMKSTGITRNYHQVQYKTAAQWAKREAANARHMVLELVNK